MLRRPPFSPVLSLLGSCLSLPPGSRAGGEDAARQGGRCSGSPAHLRSVGLMRCDSSAELLTRGAAQDYLWRDKAGGHQAGGQPEMSADKSRSSSGFLRWLGWKTCCLVKVTGKPPRGFWFT